MPRSSKKFHRQVALRCCELLKRAMPKMTPKSEFLAQGSEHSHIRSKPIADELQNQTGFSS